MNDPFLGLAVYAGAIFVFGVVMAAFVSHKSRIASDRAEAEREAERAAGQAGA